MHTKPLFTEEIAPIIHQAWNLPDQLALYTYICQKAWQHRAARQMRPITITMLTSEEGVSAIQKVKHETRCPLFTRFDSRSAPGDAALRSPADGRTARLRDRSRVHGSDQRHEGAPPWPRSVDGRCPPRPVRSRPCLGLRPNCEVGGPLSFRCSTSSIAWASNSPASGRTSTPVARWAGPSS